MRNHRKLVLAWVRESATSVGHALMVDDSARRDLSDVRMARLHRGRWRSGGTLRDVGVGAGHFDVHLGVHGIEVNAREGDLRLKRQRVDWAAPAPGDVLGLDGVALLLCVEGEGASNDALDTEAVDVPGMVGDGPAMAEVKRRIGFIGRCDQHVLIVGESGTGKELAAAAIHAASGRSRHKMVSRSAATLPSSLIEAELFGHAKNYPNHGMQERLGMVGEADGSTLFLDEIGEMPESAQARLLRVMDEAGEYTRLGESRPRHSDLRVIAATNRPLSALKPDLAARFKLLLEMPPLRDRREDIPSLVQHLGRVVAAKNPHLVPRFYCTAEGALTPRMEPDLMEALLTHEFRMNVRELDQALWRSMTSSHGAALELTPDVEKFLAPVAKVRTAPPTAEEVIATLDQCRWKKESAWQVLGLSSRFVLNRLLATYDIRRGGGQRQVIETIVQYHGGLNARPIHQSRVDRDRRRSGRAGPSRDAGHDAACPGRSARASSAHLRVELRVGRRVAEPGRRRQGQHGRGLDRHVPGRVGAEGGRCDIQGVRLRAVSLTTPSVLHLVPRALLHAAPHGDVNVTRRVRLPPLRSPVDEGIGQDLPGLVLGPELEPGELPLLARADACAAGLPERVGHAHVEAVRARNGVFRAPSGPARGPARSEERERNHSSDDPAGYHRFTIHGVPPNIGCKMFLAFRAGLSQIPCSDAVSFPPAIYDTPVAALLA